MANTLNVGDRVKYLGNGKEGTIKAFDKTNRSVVTVWFDEAGDDSGKFNITTLRKVV